MSFLTRRNRIPHQEPKEVTPGPKVVELDAGKEARIPTAVAPVQELTPSTDIERLLERGTKEGIVDSTGIFSTVNIVQGALEWASKTRRAVSRGKPRLHPSLNALLYAVFILSALWGLLKVNGYQVSVPFLCSESCHPRLSFNKPLPPDLSPWIDLLSIENDMFEHLLKDMVVGYSMSMDVIDAQMKITDLRTLIRASSRPQKELLVNDLSALLSEAKKSEKDLRTFASNIGQSLERIMGTNDWAFQRMERATAKEYARVLDIPLETPITRDFEEAINIVHKSLEVMGTDIESNADGLRRIGEDLKAVVLSIKRSDEESTRHSPKVDESTKQFEFYLHGLRDLERFAHQAIYVIESADTVIRDAIQQLETMRLDWGLSAWSALNIKPIAVGLQKLEEKRVRANSVQEEMLTRQVVE